MTEQSRQPERQPLKSQLDELAQRGGHSLKGWFLKQGLRQVSVQTLRHFYLFPLAVWLLQGIFNGASVGESELGFLGYMGYSAVLAIASILVRLGVLWLNVSGSREQALALFDHQFNLQDRLVTADDFLAKSNRDGFMEAAIDDTNNPVTAARKGELDSLLTPPWQVKRSNWLGLPGAAVAVMALLWLGSWNGMTVADEGAVDLPIGAASTVAEKDVDQQTPEQLAQLALKPLAIDPSQRKAAQRKQSKAAEEQESMRNSERNESQSKSKGSQSADAKSSGDSSGTGSNPQNQESKPSKKEDANKAEKKQRKPSGKKKSQQKQQEQKPQQPSGAMAGKGTGKSSKIDSDDLPTLSQKARGATNPENDADDGDVDDEDEQQKSESGTKPSLNTKKPAPSRESGGISPPPSKGKNKSKKPPGRGGKSGIKKSRGVPSAILGVPTPDRLTGTPNSSRFKVKQEQSTPKEENVGALQAQTRLSRSDEVGHLPHPEMEAWQQKLVKDYFLIEKSSLEKDQPEKDKTENTTNTIDTKIEEEK